MLVKKLDDLLPENLMNTTTLSMCPILHWSARGGLVFIYYSVTSLMFKFCQTKVKTLSPQVIWISSLQVILIRSNAINVK